MCTDLECLVVYLKARLFPEPGAVPDGVAAVALVRVEPASRGQPRGRGGPHRADGYQARPGAHHQIHASHAGTHQVSLCTQHANASNTESCGRSALVSAAVSRWLERRFKSQRVRRDLFLGQKTKNGIESVPAWTAWFLLLHSTLR